MGRGRGVSVGVGVGVSVVVGDGVRVGVDVGGGVGVLSPDGGHRLSMSPRPSALAKVGSVTPPTKVK